MTVNRLIWAVVVLTVAVIACIAGLTVWHPGDSTAAVTAILGVATPAISVLVLLLQGQKVSDKVDDVKREAKHVADVTAENLEGARDSARKAKDAHEQTAKVVKLVEQKVNTMTNMESTINEIKGMVDGQREHLVRRIADLEERLRRK